MRAGVCCVITPRMASSVACHQLAGSCSAQPGWGVLSARGVVALASTSPRAFTRMALTPLVPTSSPRNNGLATLLHSQQQLHGELIESLVRVALPTQGSQIEGLVH